MSTTLTPTGFTAAPVVPQAEGAGQIVGLNLQNTGSALPQPQPTSFGETFAAGAVQAGDTLTATINGQVYAVQMDAKTFNPDGSVKMAVLTVDAPALPANSTTGVMISVGGTPDAGLAAPAADLAKALTNYPLSATLNITANAGGATELKTVDIGTAVLDALSKGTATMWLNGPLAQEAIVSIPVTGSLRIEADVTAYANGTISADLQFNNDIAMSANGGTITYSTTITAGTQVIKQPSLTQYQYQDWSTTVGTAPAAGALNVQENIPYLEATGAVPNYDTQYGAASSQISGGNDNEASQIATTGWNAPLGTDGITQYMPGVGGRGDIGPTTSYNALWLITQNATAGEYALGQAQEAGSVPWHFYDPSATGGTFLSPGTPGEVNIWTDPRGNPGLTQTVSGDTGWATDQAHQPNLTYVAYMQTGNVQYLEQLNAQAAFSLDNQWNPTRQVTTPEGASYSDIIVNSGEQVRGAAWSLRQIQEAAYANPVGTADNTYFTQVTNDNYAYLDAMIPTWTQEEGQAYGYLVGAYGNIGQMAPWQQDYLASSVIEGAEMGIQNAVTFLKWESNFLVGRFFAESQGFNPANGISYNLNYYNPNDAAGQGPNGPSAFITTWAGISQASVGQSNVSSTGSFTWAHAEGDYGALALQSLAGIITVSTMNAANAATMGVYQYQAMQAFGWLLASGAPYISPNSTAGSTPQFSIDPRLANGQLLSFGNVTISTDTTPTLLTPVDASQNALIYAGSGADTLVGGKGINLLFGGSGSDVIFGGPNGNDIFAGSGNETIVAGGGANFIQASSTALLSAGTGQDLFVVDTQASGSVTISGFNAALDRIDLVDGAGSIVSASQLKGIEATATSVSGGTLYRVSPNETIFVESPVFGNSTWFSEQNQALTISDSISASLTQTSGTTTGSSGTAGLGNSSTKVGGSGGSGVGNTSIPVTTIVNGAYATIAGASNVAFVDSISGTTVNATMTGQTETITMTGGANTINAIGGSGAGMFPTYGNILMTGDNNIMSVTGGSVTISGSHDAVMIPYTYGYLSINLFGTGDTVSTSSLTSPALDIEGRGNLVSFNSESVTDTIGGTNNTVTAGTYSLIDVTGIADNVTITGETQATVSGTGNIINVTSGFHKIVAANVTGTPNLYEVGGSVGGSVTIAGYNPSLDKLRVLDSSGNTVSQSTINQIIADATTGAGAPNILKLSTGTTVLFLDLTSGTGSISSSWFEQTIPPTPIAGPTTIDGGTVIQNAGNQTILGATANIVDTVSGAVIDARRTNQQETLMLSGSAVTVNAVGAAGAENFPTYGNLFLSGNNDLVSVTAGTTTDTGNGNIITVPWQFGGGSIVELGKNATITAGANTSIPIDLEGSDNTATINAQTALQTIGGSSNTVTAGTYAQLDVTGTADQASISGEVSATVSGSADTVMATGFNKVLMTGTGDIISIPGGSWAAQDTVTGMADTVVAGGTSSTGGNQMSLFLGANNETIVTTGLEMSTISGGVGGLNLDAGGASNLVIGGPGNDAITASGGNTTLLGGSGPVDVFGNGGNITIQNVGKNISIHDGGTMTIDLTGGSTAIDLYGTQGGSPGTITIKNYQQSDVIRYAAAPGGLFTNISGPTSGTSSKPLVLSDGTSISFL